MSRINIPFLLRRKGRRDDSDRASVRFARETRGVVINPQDAARGDVFSRKVINARLRTKELKDLVKKRKKKLEQQ